MRIREKGHTQPRGAHRSTTSMASSITPTGSTTCSSPPPWEGENYEPRNPMESEKLHAAWHPSSPSDPCYTIVIDTPERPLYARARMPVLCMQMMREGT